MKALNCKFKLILAVFLLSGVGLYAQSAQKDLHEEFDTNKSTVLSIDTKFSELILNTWDKSTAEFNVEIKVKNSDKSKAEKLLKEITVNFDKKDNTIYVETVLDDNLSKGVQKVAQQFSIKITGNVPSSINLDLESKFGSSTLGSFSGKANISTAFGHLEAEQFSGEEISLEINQGEMTIGKISDAYIESNFSFLKVIEANNIDIEVNQGEAKFTKANNISAEVDMGNFVVSMVDPGFEIIDVEVNAGNAEISVSENAGFTLNASMRMGNIDIPNRIGKMEKSSHGMNESFEGEYGNGDAAIDLEGKLGNISLKLK